MHPCVSVCIYVLHMIMCCSGLLSLLARMSRMSRMSWHTCYPRHWWSLKGGILQGTVYWPLECWQCKCATTWASHMELPNHSIIESDWSLSTLQIWVSASMCPYAFTLEQWATVIHESNSYKLWGTVIALEYFTVRHLFSVHEEYDKN